MDQVRHISYQLVKAVKCKHTYMLLATLLMQQGEKDAKCQKTIEKKLRFPSP